MVLWLARILQSWATCVPREFSPRQECIELSCGVQVVGVGLQTAFGETRCVQFHIVDGYFVRPFSGGLKKGQSR